MKKQAHQVVIVGGGVAGMAAAQILERHGIEIHLIEKSNHLGGSAVKWACMATQECNQCGACLSVEMANQIAQHTDIQVHLNSEPTALSRQEGGYRLTVEGPARQELSAQGVILASGMTPFDPTILESLQYGRHPRIITTADLNQWLRSGTLLEVMEKISNPAIAFFQCIGSRNRRLGNDYCSQVCCKVALRQADKLHQLLPDAELTVCHIDLQWIGKQLRAQAQRYTDHIELLQGVPGEIRIEPDTDRLITIHEDPVSGGRITRNFDLIVLSVGMRPAKGLQSLLDPIGVPFDDWGFVSGEAPLPPRIHVAGAANFPTDIVSARQQGINAAYGLLAELEQLPEVSASKPVAVFGNGREGRRVARALQAAGYAAVLLDAESTSTDDPESYEHLCEARIAAISKTDGLFNIKATHNGNTHEYHAGALVIANGVQYQPVASKAPVVSLCEWEKTLSTDWESLPQRIVFWLDHSGPEHKSNCRRAFELAIDLTDSGRQVWIILEKVLVHGPGGQRLYDRARRRGVRILRTPNAAAVAIARQGDELRIDLKEVSLAEMEISLSCDLVVATDRVLPAPQTRRINDLIAEPLDHQGFSQWANVRYHPISSRKRGIFFVGGCHNENDAADLDGEITTLLCELASLFSPGEAPGESATIDAGSCVRCLTCLRSCTHGAITLMRGYQPEIQSEDCVGCGRCVVRCPARAIHQQDSAFEKQLASETVVFACRRSGHLAAERALADGLISPDPKISIVPVACCNSRIGISEIIQPLLKGAGRVIVAACHSGNCRSVESGGQAADQIRKQAPAMGLAPDAVRWETIAANEPRKLQQVLEDQCVSSLNSKGVN